MKLVLLVWVLFASFGVTGYSQERVGSQVLKQRLFQLQKRAKSKIRGGIKATIRFGKTLVRSTRENDPTEFFEEQSLQIPFAGRTFAINYAFKRREGATRTVIGQFGFGGDLDQGNALFFASHAEEITKGMNLLLIQSVSSEGFGVRNCHASLGGLLDTVLILRILEHLSDQGFENELRELIVIGGSSSSLGLFHLATLLNESAPDRFKGLFLQSGYVSMLEPLLAIKTLIGKRIEPTTLLHKIAAGKMTDIRLEKMKSSCSNFKDQDHFYDFLGQSFEEIAPALEEEFFEFRTGEFANGAYMDLKLDDLVSYHRSLEMTSYYLYSGGFPFVLLHSIDDPLSPIEYISRLIDSPASDYPQFIPLIMKDGGHAGYRESYGLQWHIDVIRAFLTLL